VFVTLAEPTKPMEKEAVTAGFYQTDYGKFPKIQILTIEDLFAGKSHICPGSIRPPSRKRHRKT
jgi:hypothetical protein